VVARAAAAAVGSVAVDAAVRHEAEAASAAAAAVAADFEIDTERASRAPTFGTPRLTHGLE
jgi:hypothetical protein